MSTRQASVDDLIPDPVAAMAKNHTAEALKERVYASFTGLAVVTTLWLNVDHTSARGAFSTLLISIVAIAVAGFVAELIAHQVSHAALPERAELGTMLGIAATALGSASVPLVTLLLAWLELIDLHLALRLSIGIYILVIGAISLLAVLRVRQPWGQRLIGLGALLLLGLGVVAVLAMAHGH